MTNLYLIFFGIGLLLFAGIVVLSLWQKQRSKRELESESLEVSAHIQGDSDNQKNQLDRSQKAKDEQASTSSVDATAANASKSVQSGAAKREPSIDKPSSPQQARPQESTVAEPRLAGTHGEQQAKASDLDDRGVTESSIASSASISSSSRNRPNNIVTELVARIKNPQPIEQQGLLVLFRKHDFKFHRNVHIYGLNELTEMWRDIEFELPSARFTELGVAIQLADRDGAMSKKELHDFQQMVLEFTDAYDAPFEFSMDIDEALQQAESLDKLGRRYDSMAVLNVVPRSKSGFRMADIESCARDLMMASDKNGIFMKTRGHKSQQVVLYRLACTDGSGHFGISGSASMPVHDLVVYMNVPATEDPELVFQDMVKDANSLATWLDGKVVDRGGRVMTQRSYSALMQQVSDIAFSMQQDGLTPGDPISKKLF